MYAGLYSVSLTTDGIIGFEQTEFEASESAGFVEVCVILFQPDSTEALIFIQLLLSSGTAESKKNKA